jgi:hypothetical protein
MTERDEPAQCAWNAPWIESDAATWRHNMED